ncbi:N-acetyltransferase [Mesorhizobium sp. L-8-10]|uniref:GNAT family N-acetyltransferase n=1 Tax=Mesorhizobium sp. L-8-10 TaxID=2744523 RepID=UPI001925B49F|nr:GNAT family N-acetyltransferase [Mesorhizobium sp. L-8-10]BCH28382.1 N-acetyltransferase [Mesorhizobium sp. L-8-10]
MVDLLVTYMEMISPPSLPPVEAPGAGVRVARERLSRPAYLDIYRAVGEAVQWDQRLRMDAATLDGLLAEPSNPVYVLRAEGRPVGLCEFADFGGDTVELVHFGLVPEAQGRGLGRYLLDGALRACWALSPQRVWLHTDTNDHPRAVATYERAGFRPYLRRRESFPD